MLPYYATRKAMDERCKKEGWTKLIKRRHEKKIIKFWLWVVKKCLLKGNAEILGYFLTLVSMTLEKYNKKDWFKLAGDNQGLRKSMTQFIESLIIFIENKSSEEIGLKDKNDDIIHVGSVLEFEDNIDRKYEEFGRFVVQFGRWYCNCGDYYCGEHGLGFYVKGFDGCHERDKIVFYNTDIVMTIMQLDLKRFKLIGNIEDNPELMDFEVYHEELRRNK
jgi:hypothetical protein